MTSYLSQDFIERRLTMLSHVPSSWDLDGTGYYLLDLKMCQIKSIQYGFHWGKESSTQYRVSSVVEQPGRIIKLDASLNELTALGHEELRPLKSLRELDASLNKIKSFIGIEILQRLLVLNLSHNSITNVDGFALSSSLTELNLSMNQISDMSAMPSLINLTILNVSNNQLKTLDGVQSLPRLRELYAQRNELREIIPVSSCLHLCSLNAANNAISSLSMTCDILSQINKLQTVCLHGNPIERDSSYQVSILNATRVLSLDNVSVRPLPRPDEGRKHVGNMLTLKDGARHAFNDKLRSAKQRSEDQISFLQGRILQLRNEYEDYENKMKTDLDTCIRYLDTLSLGELDLLNNDNHREPWEHRNVQEQPLHRTDPPMASHRKPAKDKQDYTGVKDTGELLRCAYNELSQMPSPGHL